MRAPPPQAAADRRAANLWPSAGVRLVLVVPEERTSLDLLDMPALPAPLAFRPLRTVPTADGRKYQTATQATRPLLNVNSRRPAAHDDTAMSYPGLVPAIYLADGCCCALRDVQALLMQIVIHYMYSEQMSCPPALASLLQARVCSSRTHTGPAHWKST